MRIEVESARELSLAMQIYAIADNYWRGDTSINWLVESFLLDMTILVRSSGFKTHWNIWTSDIITESISRATYVQAYHVKYGFYLNFEEQTDYMLHTRFKSI